MADAADSKSAAFTGVWVQVPPPAYFSHVPACTYILQSSQTGGFYTGHTTKLEERLAQHNAGRSSYTARAAPWELVYVRWFESRELAIAHERRIKKQGAKAFIGKLAT
jgi:putative endonuclease